MNDSGPFRVAVLDMQPIDPPIGGGRLRLLGLYHALGFPTTYVGTYDWRGPGPRDHHLSPTLEEKDIPLSAAHFSIAERWQTFSGGRTIIDATFPLLARCSPEFVEAATHAVQTADIVSFSHPWVYPLVRGNLQRRRQLVAYDAQNFEALLRAQSLDDGGFGTEIVKHVLAIEFELAHEADIVLACSADDARLFQEIYGIDAHRLRIFPNGVFCQSLTPCTAEEKIAAKRALGLAEPCAIFLGSNFGPNVEAVRFICERLAPALERITFVICGGVGQAPELPSLIAQGPTNVRLTGPVTEDAKLQYLRAADLAINPMFSGSGTNLKMFDFGAMALPTVSTPIGARGLPVDGPPWGIIAEPPDFTGAIQQIVAHPHEARELGRAFRKLVEESYSWECISPRLGRELVDALVSKRIHPAALEREVKDSCAPDIRQLNTDAATAAVGPSSEPRHMAMLTTWGVHCGIAEYSRYLMEALRNHGISCLILANADDPSGRPMPDDQSDRGTVTRVWRYGHAQADALIAACVRNDIRHLCIQHHKAFFDEEGLLELVVRAREAGLSVTVMMHNSRIISTEWLRALADHGALCMVHEASEERRLSEAGVRRLRHVPMGVLNIPDEPTSSARRQLGITGAPVLGSFGFLRPHKGVLELIEATEILRDLFPSIQVLALNALYPDPESTAYLSQCRARIAELELQQHVQLDTSFADITEVIHVLHACDAIVLPYRATTEGASAAGHIAIAARRPLIASRQGIFRDIRAALYPIEGVAAPMIAGAVGTVLSSRMLQRQLREHANTYIAANSWEMVASRYADLVFAPEHHPASTSCHDPENSRTYAFANPC